MPAAIQGAIQEMCADAVSQSVKFLSDKYGFDHDDAVRLLNLTDMVVKASDSKSKSKSKTTSEDKPKRGTNGYRVYSDAMRAQVSKEMSDALAQGETLKPSMVVAELGKRWKALNLDEQAEWKGKATEINLSADSGTPDKKVEKADKNPEKTDKKVDKKSPKKSSKSDSDKSDSDKSDSDKSDADKKPKKKNGYILFGNSVRAEIKQRLINELPEGEKLKPGNLMSEVAKA
jgi:Mg-chelatase subunit ChlI